MAVDLGPTMVTQHCTERTALVVQVLEQASDDLQALELMGLPAYFASRRVSFWFKVVFVTGPELGAKWDGTHNHHCASECE